MWCLEDTRSRLPWRCILGGWLWGWNTSSDVLETLNLVLHYLDGNLQRVHFVGLVRHDSHLLRH